jgi:hypothetical protein
MLAAESCLSLFFIAAPNKQQQQQHKKKWTLKKNVKKYILRKQIFTKK